MNLGSPRADVAHAQIKYDLLAASLSLLQRDTCNCHVPTPYVVTPSFNRLTSLLSRKPGRWCAELPPFSQLNATKRATTSPPSPAFGHCVLHKTPEAPLLQTTRTTQHYTRPGRGATNAKSGTKSRVFLSINMFYYIIAYINDILGLLLFVTTKINPHIIFMWHVT